MDSKKFIPIIIIIFLVGGISFWYWSQKKEIKEVAVPKATEVPRKEGTVETAKTISESVPEIQTNPGEEVPEVNPLDRANPFKYTNPLR